MTTTDNFERTLAAWLRADADRPYPDPLDAVIARTSMSRQQPWWSSLERWLPVDTTFRPRLFNAPRLSQVLLVAGLILALVGVLLLYAGSHQQKLPPPFGPARNGIILSSGNGDIVVVDPVTLSRKILVPNGFGPDFARDGTKFLFLRGVPPDCGKPDCGLYLMTANADGSGVRQLTPEGIPQLDWADWSPDGSRIAFLMTDPKGSGRVLSVVNADGTDLRINVIGRPLYPAGFLPPNGDEIVFRSDDPPYGLFAGRLDGSGIRRLSTRPAHSDNDYQAIAVSQDGRLVTYRDDGDPGGFQEHILDLGTGVDRILPGPRGQLGGNFSPDGMKIAYLRGVDGDLIQLVVAPVDGSSDGILLGKAGPWGPDGPTIGYSWTADGTALLVNYDSEQVARLVPIDGSKPIVIDHGNLALPTNQRLAP